MQFLLATNSVSNSQLWQPYFVAMISFLGVALSGIVSYFVSRYQLSIKLHELREQYSHRLHERRLETYPKLYSATGLIGYLMKSGPYTPKDVRSHYESLVKWDHDNGAIAGPRLIDKIYEARKILYTSMTDNTIEVHRKDIYMAMVHIEFEVKKELGIYSANNFDEDIESQKHAQSIT